MLKESFTFLFLMSFPSHCPHTSQFGADETYPNPLASGSFTYDSSSGFLSMQFRTTAAGFFIVRAAAEEINTLTGINIPVPDDSVSLPSFGTYGKGCLCCSCCSEQSMRYGGTAKGFWHLMVFIWHSTLWSVHGEHTVLTSVH